MKKINDYKWIEDIDSYLYIVESINKHFNKMKRSTIHNEIEEETFYLCIELLRMFPFKENKENNNVKLILKDGICLLRSHIDFLINELNNILQQYSDIFLRIKQIRNKYEHEPHNVKSAFSTGSGAYSGIGFYCKDKLISINSMDLTYIIYDLNILMSKIQNYIYDIEKKHENEFNIFTKEYIKSIKERKNIEYNKTYVRIPRHQLEFTLEDLIREDNSHK